MCHKLILLKKTGEKFKIYRNIVMKTVVILATGNFSPILPSTESFKYYIAVPLNENIISLWNLTISEFLKL